MPDMRRNRWIVLALCMASVAHADDWLAGEYEVTVPDHPDSRRYVVVVTKEAEGRYHEQVFEMATDGSKGRLELRPLEQPPTLAGVQVMTTEELAQAPELKAANVRCALVGGMGLCRIPEGASVMFDGRELHAGYFAFAMHVGLMNVRKRTAGTAAQAALPASPPSR